MDINCPEELREILIPKLLLQPIVENSFLHGFKDVHYKKEIKIIIQRSGENIIIRILDNGCGISKQQLLSITDYRKGHSRSIGLKNIEERIQLLYGANYGIDVISERKKGTEVKLKIPSVTKQK